MSIKMETLNHPSNERQVCFIDKQVLVDNGSFITYKQIPNDLTRASFTAYLVGGLLLKDPGDVLIIVKRHSDGSRILSRLGVINEKVSVFIGTTEKEHARISIITNASFVNMKNLRRWTSFIFYDVTKTKDSLISRFMLNATDPIYGLTDTYYGFNKSPRFYLKANTELLEKLKRTEYLTQKEMLSFYDIELLRKEHIWFKSGNFITINVNDKTRLVRHEQKLFSRRSGSLRWIDTKFTFFEITENKLRLVQEVKTRAEAYKYFQEIEDKSNTILTEALSENAFIPQTKTQGARILYLSGKVNNGMLLSSSLSRIIIKGLEEKMFRASALFGKIKSIINKKTTLKTITEYELSKKEITSIETQIKNDERGTKMISDTVTLESIKRERESKIKNKLLELTIELVQEDNNKAKSLTLELLKYLKD